jgi:hypothetical protein
MENVSLSKILARHLLTGIVVGPIVLIQLGGTFPVTSFTGALYKLFLM